MRRYGINNAVGMLASIKPNATATGPVALSRASLHRFRARAGVRHGYMGTLVKPLYII